MHHAPSTPPASLLAGHTSLTHLFLESLSYVPTSFLLEKNLSSILSASVALEPMDWMDKREIKNKNFHQANSDDPICFQGMGHTELKVLILVSHDSNQIDEIPNFMTV